MSSSTTKPNKQSTNTPTFPVAKAANQQVRLALRSSNNPIEIITKFQQTHSLHSFLAKSFGTTSVYSLPKQKSGGVRVTRGDVELKNTREQQGVLVEPLEPESVFTFLNHLGVSRYEIHKKIGDSLRAKLESEIQKVDLKSSNGKNALLELLKSSWSYISVPELRPVFVTLIRKLGDQTPKEVLVLLANKDSNTNKDGVSTLKYGELLNQFAIPMKRLVWEADWSDAVRGDGQIIKDTASETSGTLDSTNILSDIVRPIVSSYVMDPNLRKAADFAFPTFFSDRKMDTLKRRSISSNSSNGSATSSTSALTTSVLTGTLSTLTSKGLGKSKVENNSTNNAPSSSSSSPETNTTGVAIAKLKEVMGSRSKLLSALLNMLIAEHGLQFKKTIANNKSTSIVGGSFYLHCTLAADIILSYGQLPKQYEFVHILAQVLDESVKKGLISDQAIAQIQGCLRSIFQSSTSDKDADKKSSTATVTKNSKTSSTNPSPSSSGTIDKKDKDNAERQFEFKLLRKIINKAVNRMKENDNQRCFLKPVTDEIAPGYSKVINKPICLSEIQRKALELQYTSMSRFESDVQLMFANCIRYNIGTAGQWFRGEARRQQKKWKETILKSSKEMYDMEMGKRKKQSSPDAKVKVNKAPTTVKVIDEAERVRIQHQNLLKKISGVKNPGNKRKLNDRENCTINELLAEHVIPLPKSRNKRRKTDTDMPSMPALASMLLSDPLVVRLLVFKVLNAMKIDILKARDIPASHKTVPSVMQLLSIVQISTQLCSKRGRVYAVPDVGMTKTSQVDPEEADSSVSEAYISLRKYIPLMTKLMLEAEIDKRFSIGGDFHSHLSSSQADTNPEEWAGSSSSSSILLPLVQGALIPFLKPNASNEMSLLVQLPRFFIVLNALSGGNMVNQKPFFSSLVQTILMHKSKLPHSIRDLIVKNWLSWFDSADGSSTMTGSVHLYLIKLLNEWSSLGNLILPRDSLLAFSEDAVKAAEKNEKDSTKTFSNFWNSGTLGEVKEEYERMFKNIPEERCLRWKGAVGLQNDEAMNEE